MDRPKDPHQKGNMKFDPKNPQHVSLLLNEAVQVITMFVGAIDYTSDFLSFLKVNDIENALRDASFPEGFSVTPDEVVAALQVVTAMYNLVSSAFNDDTRAALDAIVRNIGVVDGTG